jgi:hypothetical protein
MIGDPLLALLMLVLAVYVAISIARSEDDWLDEHDQRELQ